VFSLYVASSFVTQEATMSVYEVPGMILIPQKLRMSCWYASAQMLIHWRQSQARQSLIGLVPPELDQQCSSIRDANGGMQNPQILPMATRLGLKAVPPSSVSPSGLERLLRTYGPLWVNGKTHIVVIAGVDTAKGLVKVYDPAPVDIGKIEWRPLSSWYAFGNSPSTRDTSAGVEAVFLHVPR
jgi:hypothetical protein